MSAAADLNERMKILIAYDGSACADEALDDLPRAGLPREADALIVRVRERWQTAAVGYENAAKVFASPNSMNLTAAKPARLAATATQTVADDYPASLASALRRLAAHFPEWTTETLLLDGSPAREIVSRANDWNAGLIVAGSNGRTGSSRFALGSVAQKIASEAHCSVRVVRGQAWKNGSPSRHIIGLDDSAGAMSAVEEVARRMWKAGSEVRLVFVGDASGDVDKPARGRLDAARKILERSELAVTESVEAGDPKQIIVAAAEEWGADCIFLGANGAKEEGFAESLPLGAVSTAIVARAHCMVEIVRKRRAV